jgi:hypothetical protein
VSAGSSRGTRPAAAAPVGEDLGAVAHPVLLVERLPGMARQRRVAPQHGPVQPGQLRSQVDAEPLGEAVPCRAEGGQRAGDVTGPVQRQHQLGPESLAQRVLVEQAAQVGHQLGALAEPLLRLDQVLDRDEPLLVQRAQAPVQAGGALDVLAGGAAPQRQGPSEQVRGAGRLALGERRPPVRREPPEGREVELVVADRQPVAGHVAVQARFAGAVDERPAQARGVGADVGHRGGRRFAVPDHVDQPVDRDDAARLQQQGGDEAALLGGPDRQHGVLTPDPDRPEQLKPHHTPTRATPVSTVRAGRRRIGCVDTVASR